MSLEFINPHYPSKKLRASIYGTFETTYLCSIGTVTLNSECHINTAYFCYNENLELYFLSDPMTQHGQNIKHFENIASTIFNTNQPWGSPLRGLQLYGSCNITQNIEEKTASNLYETRFPSYGEFIRNLDLKEQSSLPSRFYVFRPSIIKILDELEFGEETYVVVKINRT